MTPRAKILIEARILKRGRATSTGARPSTTRDLEASKRSLRFESLNLAPGLSLLETIGVKGVTRVDYLRRFERFTTWSLENPRDPRLLTTLTPDQILDQRLCAFFDVLFKEGAPVNDGSKLVAAIGYYLPGYHRATVSRLPRATRALKSWTKHGPDDQRLPLPFGLLCVVMAELLRRNLVAHALCLLIQFDTFLRPGEVTSLLVKQLVPPVGVLGAPYDKWAINIAPFELDKPAKPGLWDESLEVTLPRWTFQFLRTLVEGRSPSEKLWPFTHAELSIVFRSCLAATGLGHLRTSLYAIRHGGASESLLRRTRSIEDIQRRGRWRARSSLQRYTKEAKLLIELHKVDLKCLAHGAFVERKLEQFFRRPASVPKLTLELQRG